MLTHNRDDHGRIFRGLAFVDGCSIGRHQHVEFAKSVSDGPTVKARNDLACVGIDVVDVSDIAVVDLLVIVVLDLHDFVAGSKRPTEALDLVIAGGIERGLQLDVQRTCTHTATVHRTKDLDVADGIEAEPPGDPCFHELNNARHGGFGVVRLYKVEIAFGSGRAEIGDQALINTMGTGDDAALRGLPEYFGEAHHRYGAG